MQGAQVACLESMQEGIMDRTKFDDLTRAMATGASRRSVLKGMLGGVAAGAGITLAPEIAGAQDDICIEPLGECEMVDGATPCCGSYTCFEALCDNAKGCWDVEDECDTEFPCCDESMVCVDGTCVASTSAGGEDSVDELPSTGAGPDAGSSSWTGVVAAGGAAAAAALLLRTGKSQTDNSAS